MSDIKKKNLLFQGITQHLVSNPISTEERRPKCIKGEFSAQLFEIFRGQLLSTYDGLIVGNNKMVTSFKKGSKHIVSVAVQRDALKITINAKSGTLVDDKNLMRDVSKIGHWGAGDYQIKVSDEKHFEYIMDLIKQVYWCV